MTSPASLACDYASLVNDVGYHLFGLRPTTTDVITESVASDNQAVDILRAIAKGLQFVYAAHRWSFLRPRVTVTTHSAYITGTITVDALGNVTGDGTVFPTYSASAGGWLYIPSVGSFAVATYASGVALTLTGYNEAAVTVASTFSLGFDSCPLPAGIDVLEGPLTFPQGADLPVQSLDKVSEIEIRRRLARNNTPGRPVMYAQTTSAFDPTSGSTRTLTFFPIPDDEYVLTAIGTIRTTMIDSANKYPLGGDVLAPCIAESCLAAAEREIEQKDSGHPDAIHNRALVPLLAMAIQRDKEDGSPDTLGMDHGQEERGRGYPVRPGGIYWDGGGGTSCWI